MASSGNFCIWNSLNIGSGGSTSLTVGNTNAVMTGADPRTTGTLVIVTFLLVNIVDAKIGSVAFFEPEIVIVPRSFLFHKYVSTQA